MHKLIGTRAQHRADGSLHYTPTMHDLGQRLSGLLLLGLPGAFLIGGSIFVYRRLEGTERMDLESRLAIYGLFVLGILLMLWAVLSSVNWLWKRLSFRTEAGNLVINSRVMMCRRESYPVAAVEAIEFWAEPHDIHTTPVNAATRSRHVATFWVWHVDIIFPSTYRPTVLLGIIDVGAGDAPRGRDVHAVRFRMIATDYPPQKGKHPPASVVALCRWLQGATGKPVVERTDWERWGLTP